MKLANQIKKLPISIWGKMIYYVFPYRKKVIVENMRQVYGDKIKSSQIRHLIKAFYSHLVRSMGEMLTLRFISNEKLKQSVDVQGIEHLINVAQLNKGVLILTGHFGNWEYAPLGGILNIDSFPGDFYFIRRNLQNKWIEKIVFSSFSKVGVNILTKKNSLRQVTDVLKQNNAVVFVLDQHAFLSTGDGVAAPFFGKKVGTYRSLAMLSRHLDVPVVPATSYRASNNRHVMKFYEPIEFDKHQKGSAAIISTTTRYNQFLEKMILAHPEQWNWFHKRFKLKS